MTAWIRIWMKGHRYGEVSRDFLAMRQTDTPDMMREAVEEEENERT